MPNWCDNVAYFTASKETIDRICNADREHLFGSFDPTPDDLQFDVQEGTDDPVLLAKYQDNLQKHGAAHWYDWNCKHWGTKWDAKEVDVQRLDDTSVRLRFDTAWSPPTAWYEKMLTLGYNIRAVFVETGMSFCGKFSDDDCYTIDYDSCDDMPQEVLEEFPWLSDFYADDDGNVVDNDATTE